MYGNFKINKELWIILIAEEYGWWSAVDKKKNSIDSDSVIQVSVNDTEEFTIWVNVSHSTNENGCNVSLHGYHINTADGKQEISVVSQWKAPSSSGVQSSSIIIEK